MSVKVQLFHKELDRILNPLTAIYTLKIPPSNKDKRLNWLCLFRDFQVCHGNYWPTSQGVSECYVHDVGVYLGYVAAWQVLMFVSLYKLLKTKPYPK